MWGNQAVPPHLNDHELPSKGQLAVGRQLDPRGRRCTRGSPWIVPRFSLSGKPQSTERYLSSSHLVSWTRYSSHSPRLSST
jgi:hypothetical protein